MTDIREDQTLDAIVVGAGFAGIYMLHQLRDKLGFNVRVLERGGGVGGTWYWNRYPGARCDVETRFYSYSFDEKLEQEWNWSERYATQPEILSYIEHVVDRYELRDDIQLNTNVTGAYFDEDRDLWVVSTDRQASLEARFLVTAVGCLSASQVPDFPGCDAFAGAAYHTGAWPAEGVHFAGKDVIVIGTGSSGAQSIPEIAREARHLTVMQRTPNFSVPARNRPIGAVERAQIKSTYRELRAEALTNATGVVHGTPYGRVSDYPPAELRAELDRRWAFGGTGFVAAFTDHMVDAETNNVLAEYVRDKIRTLVDDPDTAEKLIPRDYPIGAKRLCVDTDYFETYNRPNVTLVSLRENPIERFTSDGVIAGDREYKADIVVFATGYDAMTGPLTRLGLRGVGGRTLADKWKDGPHTYLGLATSGFPNLFMVTAPGSPSVLTNMVIGIEQHVEWIARYISYLRAHQIVRTEPTEEVEQEWVAHVNELADRTLYPSTASWYMGANVPGKPRVFMPYLAGLSTYRAQCDAIADDGYRGFCHKNETAQ